jgi:hypothetical protein
MNVPVWQINPKSKAVVPELRAAYKVGTLHIIETEIVPGHFGYAWAVDAAHAEAGAAWTRSLPGTIRRKSVVTVRAYPYAEEVKC